MAIYVIQIQDKKDTTWFGYRFVGDNIDKNIQPSFQRLERHHVQSRLYFHGYAVKDRLNLSEYSDDISPFVTPDPSVLLPSVMDLCSLKKDLALLIARWVNILIILLLKLNISHNLYSIATSSVHGGV